MGDELRRKLGSMTEEERMPFFLKRLYGFSWLVGMGISLSSGGPGVDGLGFVVFLYGMALMQAALFYQLGRFRDTFPAFLCGAYLVLFFVPYTSFLHPMGWFFSFYKVIMEAYDTDLFHISQTLWKGIYLSFSVLYTAGYWLGRLTKR